MKKNIGRVLLVIFPVLQALIVSAQDADLPIEDLLTISGENDRYTFVLEDYGIRADFPGKPALNRELTDRANEGQGIWITKMYTVEDNGKLFMLTLKTPVPGYYLSNEYNILDESFSDSGLMEIHQREYGKRNGHNTLTAHLVYNAFDIYNYIIIKGNIVITLSVVSDPADSDREVFENFVSSLNFFDPPAPEMKMFVTPGGKLKTYAPGAFEERDNGDDSYPSWVHQHNYVNYQIERLSLGRYFQVASDSLLFNHLKNYYLSPEETSIVQANDIRVGNIDAHEVLSKEINSSNYKRMIFLPNHDTVYVLHMVGPKEIVTAEYADAFFYSAVISDPYAGKYHLENKSGILFNDLYYGTEYTFQSASQAIEDFEFSKEDLPYLHEALLNPFPDFNVWDYCTHDYIVKKVATMGDSSSIEFIRDNVFRLTEEKEILQYPLLGGLLQFGTAHSYNVFKELVSQNWPSTGNPLIISNVMDDSLAAATGVTHALLPRAKDSLFIRAISLLSSRWLNNAFITKEDILPYKKEFITLAEKMFANLSNESPAEIYHLLNTLAKMGGTEELSWVRKFENAGLLFSAIEAVDALVKNGFKPDKAVIKKIAASTAYRVRLFEILKDTKTAFPAKYSSRGLLGASEIYFYGSSRYFPESVEYLKTIHQTIHGEKMEFLLYKVTFAFDDGNEVYLGVTGPFKNKKDKGLSDIPNLYTDAFFDEEHYVEQARRHIREIYD